MIEVFLDYLQLSLPYREQTCIELEHKKITPIAFYKRGYEDSLGVRRYFGNPKSGKALVIMSGKALHNHRVVGWENEDTVAKYLSDGANITRVDWAVTEYIEDNFITVDEIAKNYLEGEFSGALTAYGGRQIVSLSPKTDMKEAESGVETFYIGNLKNRAKRGIFRAYDKGIELGLVARNIITRIELEEKRENAHNSAKRFADGVDPREIINSRIHCTDDNYQRVMTDKCVNISRGNALLKTDSSIKKDKTKEWLLKQCIPALARAIVDDESFLDKFNDVLQAKVISQLLDKG